MTTMPDHDNAPDTSRSVHLSASAGSGKTRALTERYIKLLKLLDGSGLGIDQAVAITFTDRAAAEIKKRVMDGLSEEMVRKIVRGRQDLRISTIHSFCMNLLKRYPLEAGLPPDFGVLDERDRAFMVQRAVDEALEEMDRDDAAAAPLARHTADELIDAAAYLLSIRSRLKRIEIDAGGPEGMLRGLEAGLALAGAEAALSGLLQGGALPAALREMEAILRTQGAQYERCRGPEHLQLAAAADRASALAAAEALAPVYFNRNGTPSKRPSIPKKDFAGRERTAYEDAYFRVQGMLRELRDLPSRISSGREALALLRLFQLADEQYQLQKLREGLLDFDDLEISAYGLLRSFESPDILYWLDRKVLHYLVDEFQDTSDIQWAILRTLTAEIFAGQGAEKPLPPTLFVVGDQKQSIYRFREANYRLIDRVRRLIEGLPEDQREVRTLDRNYRSVPEVVTAVNRLFSVLWKDEYQPAEPDRLAHRGSVRLIEIAQGDGDGAPAEAEVQAREVRALVERGTTVYHREDGTWSERKAGYGDCAILIQSRTRLKEYEAALMAEGVPFRVIGGIGFYDEDEVQAVMNVLFFLWNRDDRLSLAAALTSPLFGLNDADLAGLLHDGGLFEGLRRTRPEVIDLLDGWAALAGLVPIASLVHRIIGDTGAYIRFGRRSTQAIFNLDKLLDTAREFDRRGYTTLQDFVEWVRNIRSAEQREATADVILPEASGDVSIMTVHKAKGLEFPVVFLPGMNQKPRSVTHGPTVIIEEQDEDGSLRMAARGPLYDELWSTEQAELQREQERLLYVAMTRARDHLVMIGTLNPGETPYRKHSWLSSLRQAVPAEPAANVGSPCIFCSSWPDGAREVLPAQEQPSSPTGQRRLDVAIDPAAVLAGLAPVPSSRVLEWKKATDLLAAEREWALEQTGPREAVSLSPFVRGTIYHKCLEAFSTEGGYDLAAIAGEFPEVRALKATDRSRLLEEAEARLSSLTGNEELAWIFRQQSAAHAELPFLFRRGNEIISGVIDRVVVRDGTGYVVDYKSTIVGSSEDLQSWIDHYRPQVRVYCEAVKELFRLESVEGYLLFLDSGRLVLTVKI